MSSSSTRYTTVSGQLGPAGPSCRTELEAPDRVALTVRFLNSGLARWERDSQVGVDGIAPLAPFTLILTDLAVAMLDAPSSVPPQIDTHLRHPRNCGNRQHVAASTACQTQRRTPAK
jgi:hypothetical protein